MKKTIAALLILSGWILLSGAQFELNTSVFYKSYSGSVSVDKAVVDTGSKKVSLYLTVSDNWLKKLDDHTLEMLNRHYLALMVEAKVDFKGIVIYVRKAGVVEYLPVLKYLPVLPPVPKKEGNAAPQLKSLVPQKLYGNIDGGLSGKTVYVSPGHGWVYDTDSSTWSTQRGITQGMREDDSNTEIVSYFLVPYLQNAGALVFSSRETDRNEEMAVVDDTDGFDFLSSGIYEEGGVWTETTSGKGYGRTSYPIDISNNVFENGKYRYATAGTGSWARWTANIPSDGSYHIYVSYKTYTDRAQNAVYTVDHAGGSTEVTVNQQHHGSTWVDLGSFYFKKGTSIEHGSVTLNKNDEAENGSIMIADAVRFGGGDGLINRGVVTSDKPRWEEAAKVHAQFLGAPATVYQSSVNDRTSDVTARSRWAAWENEAGVDDPVFISWHSNAYNGNARGISTYIYSSDDPGTTYVTTEASEGSVELGELVHNRVFGAVTTLFDASWYEYGNGMYSAYFGEINPGYNNEMPSCLIELAFHDNAADALMLRNPKFRDIAARAAYQAVVKYFADRDGYEPVYLPGTPRNLRTETNTDGSITLVWDEPETDADFYLGHPATGYIIQKSEDGYSFDRGTDVGNVFEFTENDPAQSKPLYFRVIAYNDGGVSFPSVVAGTIPAKTGAQILVVDGFERVDANTPRFNLGISGNNRYMLEHINSFNYFIQYADVFEALGFSVDFSQMGNLDLIDLDSYDAIIWYAGEQSSNDTTFTISEQAVIAQYLEDGGAFFVSGSEIGWDLVEKGSVEDIAFFNEVLNADYINDSSGLYTFLGEGDFTGMDGVYDDGTYFYQADFADVIEPFNASGLGILYYDTEKSLGAGIITNTGKKVAVLGFPFETILNFETKTAIMSKVFEKFAITPEEIPDETPDEMPDEIIDSEIPDETADETSDSETPDETADETIDETPDETVDSETPDGIPDETTDNEFSDDLSDEVLTESDESANDDDNFVEGSKKNKKGCSVIFID